MQFMEVKKKLNHAIITIPRNTFVCTYGTIRKNRDCIVTIDVVIKVLLKCD